MKAKKLIGSLIFSVFAAQLVYAASPSGPRKISFSEKGGSIRALRALPQGRSPFNPAPPAEELNKLNCSAYHCDPGEDCRYCPQGMGSCVPKPPPEPCCRPSGSLRCGNEDLKRM